MKHKNETQFLHSKKRKFGVKVSRLWLAFPAIILEKEGIEMSEKKEEMIRLSAANSQMAALSNNKDKIIFSAIICCLSIGFLLGLSFNLISEEFSKEPVVPDCNAAYWQGQFDYRERVIDAFTLTDQNYEIDKYGVPVQSKQDLNVEGIGIGSPTAGMTFIQSNIDINWEKNCLDKNDVWVSPNFCFDRNFLQAMMNAVQQNCNFEYSEDNWDWNCKKGSD